jgi:hypothetical protein
MHSAVCRESRIGVRWTAALLDSVPVANPFKSLDALFSLNPSMKVFLATPQPASAGSFLGGTVLQEASLTIG